MSPVRILHCSPTREDHGGIQSTLAEHHRHDASRGFTPSFLSCFDRQRTWSGDCRNLAAHGWETVGALRRRFAATVPAADVAIYHDGWGLDWFAPLDGAARRVVFLHTERPYSDELIRGYAPLADGFLSVSQAYADRIRNVVPDFPAERVCVLPFSVEKPPWLEESEVPGWAPDDGALQLGYAGRVELAHKRLDRLPVFLAELDRRGIPYEFEIVGDGAYSETLARRLAGRERVRIRGWLQGENYWRTLMKWDACVFFSDYEGLSRAGMEAMMCGVQLVHPRFSEAATELLGPTAAFGLYAMGDMAAAADRIGELARRPVAERRALAAQGRAHLAHRTTQAYFDAYCDFIMRILQLQPRACPGQPPRWHDWMPLGVYTRLFPTRF
jgi:glycosyltransferase involved in cell wall biosynthesis